VVHESRRLFSFAALIAGLSACPGDTASNPFADALAQIPPSSGAPQLVALRVGPGSGNRIAAYTLPALGAIDARLTIPQANGYETIGFAPDDGLVYLKTADGKLLALELVSGRAREVDSLVAAAVVSPTGIPVVVDTNRSVGTVNNRRLTAWPTTLPALPTKIWPALGDGLLAVFEQDGQANLAKVTPQWDGSSLVIPGGIMDATAWGDLVVVATDSGLAAVDPEALRVSHFRRTEAPLTAMTISPSGHRVFTATDAGTLLVVNRFDFSILATEHLPGPVSDIRADPWGHYLLYRPVGRDSIWIATMDAPGVVLGIPGQWNDNLPTAAADGTILVQRKDGVAAVDGSTGREAGQVTGGSGQSWIVVPWNPQRLQVRLVESTEDAGDEPSGLQYYAQVSSTSNADWARDEVNRLVQAGMSAVLLPQTEWDDRFRVGLGPFNSRQAAEEAGRLLGRAFFVISINPSDSSGMR